MKIRRIDLYRADIRMKEPFRIATMTVHVAQCVFAAIHTDDGLTGWGEANPYWKIVGETQATVLAAGRDLAHVLLGQDASAIEQRAADMSGYLALNPTVRSMFDMALWDLAGQRAGVPLYELWGGSRRAVPTDRTVGMNSPENMAAAATSFAARRFPAIKLKVGRDPDVDIQAVKAVRRAIGTGLPLRIDANQGFNATMAVKVLRALEGEGIEYCEQPVAAHEIEGLAWIRSKTQVPIMADESVFTAHDALRLVRAGACDYLNVKLSKTGGIGEALRVSAIAEAAGLRCGIGCMTESRLGLTAAAHVAQARQQFVYADLDGADFHAEDPILGGMTYESDGTVQTPNSPGLSAQPSPEFLSRCETFAVEK